MWDQTAMILHAKYKSWCLYKPPVFAAAGFCTTIAAALCEETLGMKRQQGGDCGERLMSGDSQEEWRRTEVGHHVSFSLSEQIGDELERPEDTCCFLERVELITSFHWSHCVTVMSLIHFLSSSDALNQLEISLYFNTWEPWCSGSGSNVKTNISSYEQRLMLSSVWLFLPSMPQACLESSSVTVYIWPSNGKFPRSRRGRTLRRTAWPSSRWALCATSTSSSPSRSCRASSWWGTAWRSSGSPTEVSGREPGWGTVVTTKS